MNKLRITIFLLLTFSIPVFANAGVPVIFGEYFLMLIALIPIILIESFWFSKIFHFSLKKSLVGTGTANAVSTILGFPIAGALLLGIRFLVGQDGPGPGSFSEAIITLLIEAAWLSPWGDDLLWMIPASFIISLVFAWIISVFSEFWILKLFWKDQGQKDLFKQTLRANLITYGILILLNIGFTIDGFRQMKSIDSPQTIRQTPQD